jgi:adenosylcobinamide-GDP ribazoletransferase
MRNFINTLLAAVQFLTIIPVGSGDDFDPKAMVPLFPVVGLLMGLVVALFDYLARFLWSPPVVAVLDVGLLLLLSGALHVDGLGDTADGLYGQRSREKALAIMKDSRVGAMGMAAVIACLAVKWGGLMDLPHRRSVYLLLVPAYARAGVLFGMRFLPYGRPSGGTGLPFFESKPVLKDFWALIIPVSITLFLGSKGLVLILTFAVLVALILFYYKRKIGCITGDMLGAMIEVLEAGLFIIVAAGGMS